ncbi:fimbria/pilus periplasmic chaperone [Salmonella enterica]|nr:molecular chaperone [Salmonella enterica]EBO9238577.1 fimbria/pilus periplasmic chaperone [Salmonella enterica]EBP2882706.1 fimbria/pilus periplasmic chaperone [Salmonella enterica]EBR0769898.1 fimbria/pilus periplasmic chaperone [Salmonella enterica]ECJ6094714.1 fimbria/pilus periplasmic chaperone [Salmonella enterica]
MNFKKLNSCLALGLICFSISSFASDINVTGKQYGVILGSSRIVYPLGSVGTTVMVNNPQDYPVLIQSRVLAEDKSADAPFVITPPLFRLDAKQQSALRVVQTGGDFPRDKESLQWLCVKGIPPKSDDLWAEGKDKSGQKDSEASVGVSLLIAIDNCIKLMVRPSELKGDPSQVAGNLTWKVDGQKLIAENPTPFYMNLGKITFGGKNIPPHFVPPKSTWSFELPPALAGQHNISWQVINDQGGLTQTYSQNITALK